MFTENALSLARERYFEDGETEEPFWDRVGGGSAEYREMLSSLVFLPNSPTLFNLGTKRGGTLSACFVFDIDDALLGDWPEGGCDVPFADSIMGTTFKAACVAKAGGGVGYYLGNLREEGALVRSTHKKACGPVAVVKWLNQLRSLITQGGKRDLAQMGVLPARHPDARKFIHCKDEDPQSLSAFNLSLSWTDAQVEAARIRLNSDWSLLWDEQCKSAWTTGCPGMLFEDALNRGHPTPSLGRIRATNPCGETPNSNNEPCNLGSLALIRFLRKRDVDWDKLKHYIRLATRYLDDVLDWNVFPHPDITKTALASRKLGLGVMGWADMLALMRIPYDTKDAVDLGSELMRTIAEVSLDESKILALQKGHYPAYEGIGPLCRNSTRTSIAPTGSISILAGCEGSIEPHYALVRERTTYEGMKFTEDVMVWLRAHGDIGDFVPKTSHEVAPEWHVRHAAAFQKYTDLGVSKTVNLPNSATPADVSRIYFMMHELGCKGGTVFRDGCRKEQVLVSKKASVYNVDKAWERLPDDVPQLPRHKFRINGAKCYLHIGTTEDGSRPVEIFLCSSQLGSTINGMLGAWAMGVSLSLQRGTPLSQLVELHSGSRFEPSGLTGNPDLPICTSIPDYVVRYLALKFGAKQEVRGTGMLCPKCGAELVNEANCLMCKKCGYSRCG